MIKEKYYFDIGDEQFICVYEDDYSRGFFWSPAIFTGFDINFNRNFRTKEKCELYMRKQIKNHIKRMLKDL